MDDAALTTKGAEVWEALLRDGEARWPGVGQFVVLQRPARHGADPQTGQPVVIAARKVVRFSPDDAWQDGRSELEPFPAGATVRTVAGLGTFERCEYQAYEGRNPRTGAPVQVPACRAIVFTADPGARAALQAAPARAARAEDDERTTG
jgi:nucleoid DNA-binding protein